MQLTFEGVEGNGEIYLDVLRAICGNIVQESSMIDLGCYKSPYNSQLPFEYKEFVDIQDRLLDDSDQQVNFIKADAIEYLREKDWIFTVAIASDFIEHLTRENGYFFLALMEKQSYCQVIFTPLGPCCISNDDHPDSHKSGWYPEDFLKLGYGIIEFPNFHPQLNQGAFFAFHRDEMTVDFERVKKELNNKPWTKLSK